MIFTQLIQNNQKIAYNFNQVKATTPTLVLIHGAGGSLEDWPIALRDTSNFPVYTIDLPGHGQSDNPGYTQVTDYARDVLTLIKTLNLKNVVLGGHSMGGAIAQTVALQHPSLLTGLILVATGAKMAVNDVILGKLLTDFEKTIDLIIKYAWMRGTDETLVAFSRQLLLKNNPTIVHGDYLACSRFNSTAQLAKINIPTLVIGADTDKMIPPKNSIYLADNIPTAKLVIFKKCGHMLTLERPEQLLKTITYFLNTL